MKVTELSKRSLHWRLASFYGPCDSSGFDGDICQYLRAVLIGSFKVLIITVGGLVAGAALGDTFAWVAAMVMQWTYILPNEAASIVASLLTALVIFVIIGFFAFGYSEIRQNLRKRSQENKNAMTEHQQSFISSVYRKWKDRTCFYVKVS